MGELKHVSSQECPKIAETARRIMCFRPKCLNKKRGNVPELPRFHTWSDQAGSQRDHVVPCVAELACVGVLRPEPTHH